VRHENQGQRVRAAAGAAVALTSLATVGASMLCTVHFVLGLLERVHGGVLARSLLDQECSRGRGTTATAGCFGVAPAANICGCSGACVCAQVSVQYQVVKEAVYDAFYKLTDSRTQITSYGEARCCMIQTQRHASPACRFPPCYCPTTMPQ
jgi:hypothetical protein